MKARLIAFALMLLLLLRAITPVGAEAAQCHTDTECMEMHGGNGDPE